MSETRKENTGHFKFYAHSAYILLNLFLAYLRLVFTSDGVGVVVGVIRDLMT